ncbi:hypothetical protein BDK89_0793 [Ilumatobacter fluminis]|uniref:Uncharacterized protein n=1 Tax=Ilumatobacter fluminis TaxID=467091 RepID=A0A4V3EIP6_9ACTN|nr:hypothetical protein BDK89_0793 [Ilumatobacter fluminis]
MAKSSSSPPPTGPEPLDVGDRDDGATLGRVNPHDGAPAPSADPAAAPTSPGAEPVAETADGPQTPAPVGPDEAPDPLDLERIGRDLDGVEAALRRLDDGTYWSDEVTGEALPDELLAADPVARRVEG